MLKTILSVSGKPGLFKLISSNKNMLVSESLTDNKRTPIHPSDKVVSLADVSIYTENDDDIPLKEVLMAIKEKEKGNKASIDTKAKPEELRKYLSEVLPSYDKERVYPNDIKKLITWYNILIEANVEFEKEDENSNEVNE